MAREFYWILALVALLSVAALTRTLLRTRRRARRRAELQRRFGGEYERAVEETGSGDAARSELRARIRRVGRFPLRALTDAERERFEGALRELGARLADDPAWAVSRAEPLVQEVLRARGYPPAPHARQLADLSVHHAEVVDEYRRARSLGRSPTTATPAQLERAFAHYRALLTALLGACSGASSERGRERGETVEVGAP